MNIKKARGRRLRKIMADHDLKAPEVARILGIRPQTVRCYACGVRSMPKRHLDRLAGHTSGVRA